VKTCSVMNDDTPSASRTIGRPGSPAYQRIPLTGRVGAITGQISTSLLWPETPPEGLPKQI
jgi:hypothetical protein